MAMQLARAATDSGSPKLEGTFALCKPRERVGFATMTRKYEPCFQQKAAPKRRFR
jgi:hypothetical protein